MCNSISNAVDKPSPKVNFGGRTHERCHSIHRSSPLVAGRSFQADPQISCQMIWKIHSGLCSRSNCVGIKITNQDTTRSCEALPLWVFHLVTHMAYGKRCIKITSNLQVLVLQDWLPKMVFHGGPVTAEEDRALTGRENFGGLYRRRVTC